MIGEQWRTTPHSRVRSFRYFGERLLCPVALACLVAVAIPNAASAEASTSKATADSFTVLLVDDYHVLYRPGTDRAIRPLDRFPGNPMIVCDKPWEGTVAYCSVHRDGETGNYTMWYQAWSPGEGGRLCYATSEDGIDWQKPEFDLHPFKGVEKTNILLETDYGAGVLVDEHAKDPDKKYKFAYWDSGEIDGHSIPGMCLAFSPDGIHWTKYGKNPVIRGDYGPEIQPPFEDDPRIPTGEVGGPPISVSDVIDPVWDPKQGVYAVYAKTWLDGPDGVMHTKRAVVRTESEDFLDWTDPVLVAAPDELDPEGMQIHSGPAFYHKGVYFATLQMMQGDETRDMPLELALSRDGYDFQRPFRDTMFLPELADNSTFDASLIWSNGTPIVLDDEIRFYYGAYADEWYSPDMYRLSGIGMATMPLDRFAGVCPIDKVGQITLKAIDLGRFTEMTVNADAYNGEIRVEVLNEEGYRVPGFSKDAVTPLTGDGLRHPVRWGDKSIADLEPRAYRLRIHLDNATVYALTFRKDNS